MDGHMWRIEGGDLNARHAVERGACMEKKTMRVESGEMGCELV
jgi:hypothetical protein